MLGNVPAVPVLDSQPTALEAPNCETETDSSYSETGWTSSEDEDEDEDEGETDEMRQARTLEQIRVLHAAGLLVAAEAPADLDSSTHQKSKPDIPDRLLKRRKTKKGTKPDRPHRRSSNRREKSAPDRPLPPPPPRATQPEEAEVPLEDAYDRYVRLSKEVVMRPVQSSVVSPALVASPSSPQIASPGDDGRGSGLLNTIKSMSRGRASDIERRSTPKISGPISSPQTADSQFSAQGARASPALGTASGGASWSVLVGENALEMIPEKERKRQEAIFEFILTESSHVRDLQIIVEVFFNSMQSLLSSKASTVIFANIEDVLLAAVSFLSDLEQRQRESRLYLDQIADVLDRHMPNMQAYLPYCVNQGTASEILKSERRRDPNIELHLQSLRDQHPATRNLDLSSFLLIPMQRITRYPLLIGQIQRYTEADHPDYPLLQSAQNTAESLLNTTNEAIREQQDASALRKLSESLYIGQARLDLTKPTRHVGKRRILKEETIGKAKSGRKVHALLCNDMLLLLVPTPSANEGGDRGGGADPKHGAQLYHMPLPLEEISVKDLVGKLTGRDDSGFTIVHHAQQQPGGAGGSKDDRINLRCSSPRAAHAWMKAIEDAKMEVLFSMQKIAY